MEVQLLRLQGFWQHQVLRGVGGQGSRKYSALEGYGNQYWPIYSSILPWRTPSQTEAWQSTVHRVTKSRTLSKQLCTHRCKTLLPVATLPQGQLSVTVAACLAGSLVAPNVQGHGLPLPQELWPYQRLFLSLL